MLFEQAYLRYLVKVEKNAVNDNISTERGRFALLYNESQNRIIEALLDRRGEDDIHYINKLLVKNVNILPVNHTPEVYNFTLPKNYFDFANVWAVCSKQYCKKQKLDLFELQEEDENLILSDEYQKSSFLWRESLYTISSNQVNVYYDDFSVDSIKLSYYRQPLQITLLDPENPESQFPATQTEFDDKLTDRIISLAAGEFELNQENPFFQAQKQRATAKA